MCPLFGGMIRCLPAAVLLKQHKPLTGLQKEAVGGFSWHMRDCGLIVLVEMAQGIGTGGYVIN